MTGRGGGLGRWPCLRRLRQASFLSVLLVLGALTCGVSWLAIVLLHPLHQGAPAGIKASVRQGAGGVQLIKQAGRQAGNLVISSSLF